VYDKLDRSEVKAMRRRRRTYREIAAELGCNKKTVKRILESPTDKTYERDTPGSQVDRFKPQILEWLENETPVQRMLELAREKKAEPFTGSRSAFYARVQVFREEWKQARADRFVRFEGLPGEYAQVDWGEVRNFPFLRAVGETRYFLAIRLKFSRLVYVEFAANMTLETLIRIMLRGFESFGGVAWVSVFDNMRTVTSGRDSQAKPIWNPTFFKFMTELDSHPEACWPKSGNQKGAVENLVGWVKSNFLPERHFLDDADLALQATEWVDSCNGSVSQAHDQIPAEVHREHELHRLTPLKTTASEYGIFRLVRSGPESLISIDSNRYSVPVAHAETALVARVRERFIDFYAGDALVAHHERRRTRVFRPIQQPEHFEAVLVKKPRARVMLYRDHLIEQDSSVAAYLAELCRRKRGAFGPQILEMYGLWRAYGTDQLGVACALASEHEAYGVDYLRSLLTAPRPIDPQRCLEVTGAPLQTAVDRNLQAYEVYVERTGL